MKLNLILEEMMQIAQNMGVTVRKENGKFRSASCEIKSERLIVLNKSTPLETMSSALAVGLAQYPIDDFYIKPVVRDYIEEQVISKKREPEFELEVEY